MIPTMTWSESVGGERFTFMTLADLTTKASEAKSGVSVVAGRLAIDQGHIIPAGSGRVFNSLTLIR